MKRNLIPTPLVDPATREPIRIEERPIRIRFRTLFLAANAVRLLARLVRLRLTGTFDDRVLGRLLFDFCQRMGVLWMKVGQLLSIRGELLPQAARDELAQLQDRASGFSPDAAVRFIEQELGAPISEVFAELDRVPFAAASISQVHRALLRREQIWVAIKVQRPEVERVFASDFSGIKRLVGWLKRLSILTHIRWDDLLWELEQLMTEELDYRFEAANLRRMRKTLRPHGVYAPKVYRRYSTRRVLTMEYVDGVFMSDYMQVAHADPARLAAWLQENAVEPEVVARRLLFSNLRQTLEDNLFHCDLHPGNIVLLRESRIAFIDFGSVGFAERGFLRKYEMYLEALATGHYSKMVDLYWLFVVNLPRTDLSELKDEVVRRILAWETRRRTGTLPYEQRSLGVLNDELVRLVGQHGIALDWTFLRLTRAWFTMDISMRELAPGKDLKELTQRYLRKKERRAQRELLRSPPSIASWIETALDLPGEVYEQSLYRGEVVRRLAMIFEGTTSTFSRLLARVCGVMAGATTLGAILSMLIFARQYGVPWLDRLSSTVLGPGLTFVPRLDYQLWILILLVLIHAHRTSSRLKRQFQRAEVRVSGA